jgi:hypothetical protein
MTDWTPEEDEAFNEVEKHSNLGKQILRDVEGQPYVYTPKREWVGLTKNEVETISYIAERNTWIAVELTEAKLKEKNT